MNFGPDHPLGDWEITPERRALLERASCTGAFDCPSAHHIHGCYSDDPCPHEDTA